MRCRLLALVLGLLAAAVVPSAQADGLPVEGVDASLSGIAGPSAEDPRYVTLPAERGTVVAAVAAAGGEVLTSRFLSGRFTVPVVAYDGTPGGLSADGRTLVLIRPRAAFPRRSTTFAILGTDRLRARDVFTLEGDFSFDALSPDGRWLYLVQYLSKRDPSRYLVRLYDLRRGRMLPEPVIDPREVGDVMRGMPVTRASSPDGRVAYTLYDGAGEHPFIHALDTVAKSARCIDLHGLVGFELLSEVRLDLSPEGGTLSVVHGQEPLALVDTRTDEVTEPAEPGQSAAPAGPEAAVADPLNPPRDVPWPLVAGGALVALVLLTALVRVGRGRPGPRAPTPSGVSRPERDVDDDPRRRLAEIERDAVPERSRVLVR